MCYRPLPRDALRPLPRPKTGFIVDAMEVLPEVLTFTPGPVLLCFGMAQGCPCLKRQSIVRL